MSAMVQKFSWGERWSVPFNKASPNLIAHVIFYRMKIFVPLHKWKKNVEANSGDRKKSWEVAKPIFRDRMYWRRNLAALWATGPKEERWGEVRWGEVLLIRITHSSALKQVRIQTKGQGLQGVLFFKRTDWGSIWRVSIDTCTKWYFIGADKRERI